VQSGVEPASTTSFADSKGEPDTVRVFKGNPRYKLRLFVSGSDTISTKRTGTISPSVAADCVLARDLDIPAAFRNCQMNGDLVSFQQRWATLFPAQVRVLV